MGWSRPIPFYKEPELDTTTNKTLLHSLGATQRIRIINMWGAAAGKPLEITLRYHVTRDNTLRRIPIAHGVVSDLVYTGNPHLEVWAEALDVNFQTDDLEARAFYFGGEYKVKR